MASADPLPAGVEARPVAAATPATDWRLALVRLIEGLAWPVAFVIVALIFRAPLTAFIAALAHKLGG